MARVVIKLPAAHRTSREATFRYVRDILREIRLLARLRVSHGPYTTGRLAQSIQVNGPYIGPNRVHGSVGTDKDYATVVNSGSGLYGPQRAKYTIRPRPPTRYLRFYWRRVGGSVYFKRVRHPGQRGKRFLTDALREVARRHNLRVNVYRE